MEIKLFSDLKAACRDLVDVLPSLNDSQRKEMRNILLQLKGDISGSLVLAEQYLNGILRSTRESDILQQMNDAPVRLMHAYNEFKICAALYHLHDRFEQWFSSIKLTVNATKINAIRDLIKRVAGGERFIMDELQVVLRELPNIAQQYENAEPHGKDDVLQNARRYVKDSLSTLRHAESETKKTINAVIALM